MRASLFITCFNDTLFPRTGIATTTLLERLGHQVDFPEQQTCCGQMHANSGYADEAIPLVRRFVRAFAEAEAIVSPSASCVGMVRDQYPKLAERAGDAALAAEVEAIRARTFELTELLTDRLNIIDVGAYFPHRVTYHPTCHGLRGLRLGDRPLRLLRAVEGIDLVELPLAEECCGFGGTFAVKNPDTSAAMLADKLEAIRSTGAQFCTAGDNSCLMHIGGGLARAQAGGAPAGVGRSRAGEPAAGRPPRPLHIAEILAATR